MTASGAQRSTAPWATALPPKLAAALEHRGRVVKLKQHQILHAEGDDPDGLYVLAEGRVRVSTLTEEGRELVVSDFHPGDLFGETSVFDGLRRTHDAFAVEDSRLMVLPPEDVYALLRAEPDLCRYFLRMLALKLRMCFMVLNDAALLPAPARLARRLIWLSGAYGPGAPGTTPGATPRLITLSQSELAMMVGSSRQTVNRELKAWERAGVLERRDEGIVVRDMDALAKLGAERTELEVEE